MAYRIGVINDLHIPFQDPRSVGLVLDIYEDIGVDEIILNGDVLDFYAINMHGPKHPEVQFKLQDELEEGRSFLEKLRNRFKDTKIIFNAGNHEDRLDRFILNSAPPFWDLVTVEKQLRLAELNIPYRRYQEPLYINDLIIVHSPSSYGVNGARTMLTNKPGSSYLVGCTHRLQTATITDAHGKVHSCHFNGWLGSTTLSEAHKRVFSYAKGHENWQQCFAIVTVTEKDTFVQQYQIKNYKASVDGYLYEG